MRITYPNLIHSITPTTAIHTAILLELIFQNDDVAAAFIIRPVCEQHVTSKTPR